MSPSRRSTLPVAVVLTLLTAACGSPETNRSSAGPIASSAAPGASSAAPSVPSPPSSAASVRADEGPCPVTAQELEAASKVSWKLGRTLPEQPWALEKSIRASTCVFLADAKAVTDSYGQPLILRIDTATGAHAAAMEKYDNEVCVSGPVPGTMRAPRGGGGGKVCDVKGVVTDGSVVKDGSAMSILLSSDSDKILKEFSPAFEAIVAAIAD